MNLFKGLIKCKSCGKNYNFKNDNGIPIYVCAGYKNYGSNFCPRNIIHEKNLIRLVKLHMDSTNKNYVLLEEYIKEYIQRIEVDGDNIKIFYQDGISEWNNSKLKI